MSFVRLKNQRTNRSGKSYLPIIGLNGFIISCLLALSACSADVMNAVDIINDQFPVATEQSLSIDENTPISITLSGTDSNGLALSYSIGKQPDNGRLTGILPDLNYMPGKDFVGSDNFSFSVNNGIISSASAVVSINVVGTSSDNNAVPQAMGQSLNMRQGDHIAINLIGTDPDNDPLSYTIISDPANGELKGTAPNVIYTPNRVYVGNDRFTFIVNDGSVNSNEATVSIDIAAIAGNTPPVAASQSVSTQENTAVTITLIGTDADGDSLSYAIVTSPAVGTLTGSGANRTYIPNPDANGEDSFTFTVNDGMATSNLATVSIMIEEAGAPLTITTTSLMNGKEGDSYSQALSATGASLYTWSLASGTLPDGIRLAGANLNGTPTSSGSYEFTLQVSDSADNTRTDSQTFTLVIDEADSLELAITTGSLQGAIIGQVYSDTLAGRGGDTANYSWSWDQGSQVAGLSLNTDGSISGTATGATMNYDLVVTLNDGVTSVERQLTLQVTDTSVASACQDSGVVMDMSLDGPASSPQIGINLTTNRISGIAPLSVFFDAANTTHTDNNIDPFLDLHYQWYFHDTAAYSSGTWKYSCKSKNLATGPLAAHIFDDPGTYQVRLTVMDRNGNQTSTTVDITVESPESLTTYCVADVSGNGGDFMGCPLDTNSDGNCDVTPNQCLDSSNMVNATRRRLTGGNRILFRRGDTFTGTTTGIRFSGSKGIVGAFGAESQPAPIWLFSDSSQLNDQVVALRFNNAFDWRFMDIDLVADPGTFTSLGVVLSVLESRNILQYRVSSRAWGNFGSVMHTKWNGSSAIGADFFPENIFIVDVDYTELADLAGGWAMWFQMDSSAMMGVFVEAHDKGQAEGIYRSQHSKKVLIQHNRLQNPGIARGGKQNISIRTCEHPNSLCTANTYTEEVIISDNILVAPHMVGPIQVPPGPQRRYIVERNFIHYGASVRMDYWDAMHFTGNGPEGLVVRNNISDQSMPSGYVGIEHSLVLTGPNQAKVYNNTMYWKNNGGSATICTNVINGPCTNNLIYAPGAFAEGSGTENNLANADFSGSPFSAAITVPPLPQQFIPDSSQMPSGTTLVAPKAIDDFFGNIRPLDSISVGAAEYQ